MKIRHICLLLAALLCGGQSLRADILILKNGEKKEGNILEERPDAIRMKYKITPKIWDEKDFPRADIQQIIKQKPEEIEIVELRKVLPVPDLLTANEYEQIIQDKLRPFVNKFPGTPQAKDVEAMISELQAEKDKVVAGQLKMEGQWLTAELVKRDDYNIQAYKIRRAMQRKAAELDYTGALREFDRLSGTDSGYPASLHYVKAVPEAIDIMVKYEAVLTRMIAEQPIFQKQRDDSLKKLVEPDLGRTNAAINREKDAWKATYDAEKKSKVKWMTQYKYDLKALQAELKTLMTERGKLQVIDLAKLQTQNEALTNALRYLADENVTEADTAIRAAQAVGIKESASVISTISKRIAQLKNDLKTKTKNSTIGSGSSAVAGSSAAITDDRVAQAMAQADKSKDEKKAAVVGETKTPDDATMPDDKKPDAAKGGKDEKDEAEAKPKSKSKAKAPRSSDTDSSAAIAPPAEESGVQQYLLIGAGVLIVVLLAALLLQKKTRK